jgi:hypothetical protein
MYGPRQPRAIQLCEILARQGSTILLAYAEKSALTASGKPYSRSQVCSHHLADTVKEEYVKFENAFRLI